MNIDFRLNDLDFDLPKDQIAQYPLPVRDTARLLVFHRDTGKIEHSHVRDLPELLRSDDLLVRNISRVVAARLRGNKATGGRAEALLLGRASDTANYFRSMLRCKGRLRTGLKLYFSLGGNSLEAEVVEVHEDGEVTLAFPLGCNPYLLGELPLPPYIRRGKAEPDDRERYQTVYASVAGSIAAPTAGLHFTMDLLAELGRKSVQLADVVLHVGPGTFRPIRPKDINSGTLHSEVYDLPVDSAAAINNTRKLSGRIVAIGTTTARVLESRVQKNGLVSPGKGKTDLFLRPGSSFYAIDGLLTNFHLPGSSLLLLVAAMIGPEHLLETYNLAIRHGYRFYSYGDAMLII